QFEVGRCVALRSQLVIDANQGGRRALRGLQSGAALKLLAVAVVLGDARRDASDLSLQVLGATASLAIGGVMQLGLLLRFGRLAFTGGGVALRLSGEPLKQGMKIGSGAREPRAVGRQVALDAFQLRLKL